ncbi:hypothetical protein NCU16649 [Neurospora crassa OR74A]|uniref:Uncharacterized protein n=1 Tax=Neurospora crassa (strain ATCC 24698 / 74-OR23-1A / CBS 708.71 / DSM 1257 / FGSC 987) TaxID=367110 RepID=U9W4R8_NEUCR|nr:hypothetical protein NCU16649 [Neurospora crassa OR74A]ESA43244.1 hypothetical protein NCU16649 [Neurospora crassa OR74A]|eukprot:XP_011394036.1 hypothetical protein NCU16649 [Neurospora crassa OR74A]
MFSEDGLKPIQKEQLECQAISVGIRRMQLICHASLPDGQQPKSSCCFLGLLQNTRWSFWLLGPAQCFVTVIGLWEPNYKTTPVGAKVTPHNRNRAT